MTILLQTTWKQCHFQLLHMCIFGTAYYLKIYSTEPNTIFFNRDASYLEKTLPANRYIEINFMDCAQSDFFVQNP